VGDSVTQVERYSLLLFDYDAVTLNEDNRRIIELVKRNLRAEAAVRIIGSTDRLGEAEYNRRLSRRRAEAAAEALGRAQVEISGIGEDTRSFPNDLPEGRFYSRTVIIELETQRR